MYRWITVLSLPLCLGSVVEPSSEVDICSFANPDTTLAGVKFNDAKSSCTILGYEWEPIDNEFGVHQVYQSADAKQFLIAIFHEGGIKYEYSEFILCYSWAETASKRLADTIFKSGSGIVLGMSRDKVVSILGSCFTSEIAENTEVLTYAIPDIANSNFLTRWNEWQYYTKCTFTDSVLTNYKFGFEYP